MKFRIRALTAAQIVNELVLEAIDEQSAREEIAQRGWNVLSISAVGASWFGSSEPNRSVKFPLLLFSQELLALLQSGLPLVEAIETLAEKETRVAIRETLNILLLALREGRPLSAAMATQRSIFPDLFVALIKASERTSDLDQALTRYIAYRTQVDAVRARLVSASIYPLLLLAVGTLVVLFLLGYVVPRFAGVFEEMHGDLPWMSRLLIEWGTLIERHALGMAVGFVAVIICSWLILRRAEVWAALGRGLWSVPAVGERLKIFQLSRFYRTLGMLLTGGMPAVTALQMLSDLLSPILRPRLAAAINQVREGHSLSETLHTYGLTTPVASRMLRVGERAGNLGEMAERVAAFHEEEISRWSDHITRVIGPVLMLIIGFVIGLVVVLMYLPIFQLTESL